MEVHAGDRQPRQPAAQDLHSYLRGSSLQREASVAASSSPMDPTPRGQPTGTDMPVSTKHCPGHVSSTSCNHPPSSPAPADVIPWLPGAPVPLPRRVHAVAAYRRPTAEARARQTSILGFRQAADNAVPVSFPRSVPPHVTAIQSIQVRPAGPACRASTVSEFDALAHRPPSDNRPPDAVLQCLPPSSYPLATRLQSAGARLAGYPYSPLPSYHHPCLVASKTCFRPGSSRQSVGRHHVPRHLPLGGLRVHIRPFPVSHRSVPSLQETSNPHRDNSVSLRLQLLQSPIPGVIALSAHCAPSPLPLVLVTLILPSTNPPIHPPISPPTHLCLVS